MSRNTIEPLTRYSDGELAEFKVLIEEKLGVAKNQLESFKRQLQELSENEGMKIRGLDDGIGTAENERLASMASRQRKHIQHLENALIRIKNKAYGICRVTGKLISKDRLRVVPHATLSIEAKQQKRK